MLITYKLYYVGKFFNIIKGFFIKKKKTSVKTYVEINGTLTLVLLNLDLFFFENIVDPDQLLDFWQSHLIRIPTNFNSDEKNMITNWMPQVDRTKIWEASRLTMVKGITRASLQENQTMLQANLCPNKCFWNNCIGQYPICLMYQIS